MDIWSLAIQPLSPPLDEVVRREFEALRTTAIGLAITDQCCGFLRLLEPLLACSGNFGGAFSSKGGMSVRGSCSSAG